MHRILLLVLTCTSTTLAAPAPKEDKIRDFLVGEWVAIEVEEKGKQVRPGSDAKFDRTSFYYGRPGSKWADYPYEIRKRDGDKGLYEIDIRPSATPNHALLQVVDDSTIILVVHSRFKSNKPTDRPTSLTSKPDKEKDPEGELNPLLFKFKRVPKGKTPADVLKEFGKGEFKE
jgi:hypothetical protein